MQYQAARRIQIRSIPDTPNELAYHEDRGDGTPLCGQLNKDWEGRPVHYAQVEAGDVTCERCAQILDEDRRAKADADAEGKRMAGEEAARAERVRKIRESGARLALPELDASLRRRPDSRA
jgi:hypothetical protein